jgi:CheY-like chemotaxis protein
MVQRHSADIELESQPGKGTTVRLIFPVSAPVMTSAVRSSAPPHPAQRLRLLVVDDDPLLIKSLRDTLGGDGHLITTADSGQKGIEAFIAAEKRGEPFAVVITDLGMPHVDGRKVATAVKAVSPATPVILLTGWGQRLMAQNDVPPHVDRLLNKPPKLHELRSALAELTAGAGQIKMP